MSNAILTSPLQNGGTDEAVGMPNQALVAILTNGVYQLSYERSFDGLAPSLASAVVAGSALQASPDGQAVKLATSGAIDLNTAAATTLYTCPAGFQAIIRRIILRNASVSLTTVAISFGWNSASFNDVVANSTYTALTGATLYSEILPKAGAAVGVAAGTFKVIVNTPQGAAATAIIDVFGYLVEV